VDIGNLGPGSEQTQTCGGVKPVNGIPTLHPRSPDSQGHSVHYKKNLHRT